MSELLYVFIMFLDDRLVEPGRLLVLVLLHEEHVGHIQLPDILVVTELDRLAKDLLHLHEVITIPVDLGLLHQNRQIPDTFPGIARRSTVRKTHAEYRPTCIATTLLLYHIFWSF